MVGFALVITTLWISYLFVGQYLLYPARERVRLNPQAGGVLIQLSRQFNLMLASVSTHAQKKKTVSYQAAKAERELLKKLRAAGLESAAEQGKFYLFRGVFGLVCPSIGLASYSILPAYYATVFTIILSIVGLIVPVLWLRSLVQKRTEDIERELPLYLDMVNLATSAGWDLSAALEKVTESLHNEFPQHPLFKELKRAGLLTSSGYTWREALDKLAKKLDNDSVKRSCLALIQAMKQGGDRRDQIENIAEDAQRIYYTTLDRRLAALPVKVIFVTMMLLLAYFIFLLSPTVVQLRYSVGYFI